MKLPPEGANVVFFEKHFSPLLKVIVWRRYLLSSYFDLHLCFPNASVNPNIHKDQTFPCSHFIMQICMCKKSELLSKMCAVHQAKCIGNIHQRKHAKIPQWGKKSISKCEGILCRQCFKWKQTLMGRISNKSQINDGTRPTFIYCSWKRKAIW